MTLDRARAAAQIDADELGTDMAVYRFPSWPEGVYGARSVARLPKEALQVEVVKGTRGTEPTVLEPAPDGRLF